MTITLNVQTRDVHGKKVKRLRREGLIPAVLAGKGIPSREVAVPLVEFTRLEKRLSSTTLMDVVVDDSAPVKALLHKVQMNTRTSRVVHLELLQVSMGDTLKVEAAIHIHGSSPAVTELGGTLVIAHPMIEVRAHPDSLVSAFHVDISPLQTFDDHIRAGDVPMPPGVELVTDPETILVSVAQPRVERVEAEAPIGELFPTEAPAAE